MTFSCCHSDQRHLTCCRRLLMMALMCVTTIFVFYCHGTQPQTLLREQTHLSSRLVKAQVRRPFGRALHYQPAGTETVTSPITACSPEMTVVGQLRVEIGAGLRLDVCSAIWETASREPSSLERLGRDVASTPLIGYYFVDPSDIP